MIGTLELVRVDLLPANMLVCDGRLVSSDVYSELYAAIGTTYGGDEEDFALPNLEPIDDTTRFAIVAISL